MDDISEQQQHIVDIMFWISNTHLQSDIRSYLSQQCQNKKQIAQNRGSLFSETCLGAYMMNLLH